MGLSSDQVDAERRARQDDLTDIGNLIALPEPQWPEEILVPGPGVDATGEAVLGWPVTAPGPLSPAPADGTQMWSWLLSAAAQTLSGELNRPDADTVLYLLLRWALLWSLPASGLPPTPTSPFAARGRLDGQADDAPSDPPDEVYGAVGHLQQLPQTTLERLLYEHLDLVGYRWDAWATSMATLRLAQSRQQPGSGGVLIGGYAFVENLSKSEPGASTGYISAPSVGQAATAAVLRSGQLNHELTGPAGDAAPFAIDLSSARARVADICSRGFTRVNDLAHSWDTGSSARCTRQGPTSTSRRCASWSRSMLPLSRWTVATPRPPRPT